MKIYILILIGVLICAADQLLALSEICEGFFCETQHIDLIVFESGNPQNWKSVITVYPSTDSDVMENLTQLSTWIPSQQTYVGLISNPATSATVVFTFSWLTKKYNNFSIPYSPTIANLNYDRISNTALISYGGQVKMLNLKTSGIKSYFTVFDSNTYPSYVPSGPSFWNASTQTFGEVVMDTSAQCYYYFWINTANMNLQQSKCFPAYQSGSISNLGTYFLNGYAPGQFFAFQFDSWGGNYFIINGKDNSVVSTILNFVDFANLGWFFDTSFTLYTYNPASGVFWGLVTYLDNNDNNYPIIGGVNLNTQEVYASQYILNPTVPYWSNFQAIYS